MSDDDTKKPGGYRFEYAPSNRLSTIITSQALQRSHSGNLITKGELRLGSQVDFRGNVNFVWRHWGCTTPAIISKFKDTFDSPDELDGFEDLKAADQERIRKAWEDGKVAEEDIPETARKTGGDNAAEDEGKPKKKSAAPKKKAKKDEEGDVEKPKKKSAAPKKTPAAKKAPAKKKAAKKDSDSEDENFADELDKVSEDEDGYDDGDDDATGGKKRKRPAPKKAAETKPKKTKKPAPKKSKKKVVSGDEDEED